MSFEKSQVAGAMSIDLTKDQLSIESQYHTHANDDSSHTSYSIDDMVIRGNNLWTMSSSNSNYPLSVFK